MACEDLQAQLDDEISTRNDINDQLNDGLKHLTAKERQSLIQQLHTVGTQIEATQRLLNECLKNVPPPPPSFAAPSHILETDQVNPPFNPTDPDWNVHFRKPLTVPVFGTLGSGFPYTGKEWTQVLNPGEEYDDPMVGASGWVINPSYAGGDFPFDHPWGPAVAGSSGDWDWEFQLAVDPQYQGLLGPGNKGSADPQASSDLKNEFANETRAAAVQFKKPADGSIDTSKGLLGVEWESHNVPVGFRLNVTEGDRTVVFGRWIVDCGHDIARTEIHPPLLMACASATNPDTTRVLFTSRPYLVGQTFTTNLNAIYHDFKDDDGEFMEHMVKEVGKVNDTLLGIPLSSTMVEAHPKIKSWPFRGNPRAHFIIRPSSPQHTPSHSITDTIKVQPQRQLSISSQFTVRSGCTVEITSPEPDRVDVVITLIETSYPPPPLPPGTTNRVFQKPELEQIDQEADKGYLKFEVLSGIIQGISPIHGSLIGAGVVTEILERGIKTDHYDSLESLVDVLDTSQHAVNAFGSHGPGIVHDDTQPFPVFGWLEVKWVESVVAHQ